MPTQAVFIVVTFTAMTLATDGIFLTVDTEQKKQSVPWGSLRNNEFAWVNGKRSSPWAGSGFRYGAFTGKRSSPLTGAGFRYGAFTGKRTSPWAGAGFRYGAFTGKREQENLPNWGLYRVPFFHNRETEENELPMSLIAKSVESKKELPMSLIAKSVEFNKEIPMSLIAKKDEIPMRFMINSKKETLDVCKRAIEVCSGSLNKRDAADKLIKDLTNTLKEKKSAY